MTASNGIPKRVEQVLTTHRRGFLRSAGLLVVSVGQDKLDELLGMVVSGLAQARWPR